MIRSGELRYPAAHAKKMSAMPALRGNGVAVGCSRAIIAKFFCFMNEWNIQSRAHACQACNARFANKDVYHTLLFDEKAGLTRLDICQICWSERENLSTDRKGFISHWQGIYETPPAPPSEAIQKESAETLLRKLVGLENASYAATCYILAAMLERKRLLKVKEQVRRQDGHRTFVYEYPRTGEIFTIADPDLQLNQLDEVQKEVAHLLEHGLSLPGSADQPGTDQASASVSGTHASALEGQGPSERA